MFCIVLQIHRNILSSQCYIRCVDDSNSFNTIQVECFSSELELSLLLNDEIVKKVKMITPKDFFIPSSLSSDTESSVISGSTVVCRATLTPARQSIVECSFRLQISGADKLDPAESELKVDVKDFFKERFKNGAHWDLFCASCGVGLPLEHVYIGNVREYCESELSEGWFCHGNGPQSALCPSSQVLYMDDTSFYLYPTSDINREATTVLDKKCCNNDCRRDGCISALSTKCSINSHSDSLGINCSSNIRSDSSDINCSSNSHSDSSGINCSSKFAGDCCDGKNIDKSISQTLNSFDFPTSNSDTLDIDSSHVKQTDSSAESCNHHSCENVIHSTVDKNEYLNGPKVLYSPVECQSCGDILTSEKSSVPFIRFYLDKLMFKNSSFNEDHLEYARNTAMLSFWSLVTRSQTSLLPSKLFLQSKVRDEELCLLLWVPSAPVAQFLLRDSLEAAPAEIHLRTEPVYKVLYFVGTSLSENVRSWRYDFGVDFYLVSDTMVKTLVGILDASSSHLPEASAAGGFSCGFLRAPLSCEVH